MKKFSFLVPILCVCFCTKKIGHTLPQSPLANSNSTPVLCQYSASTTLSFSSTVLPLLISACGNCHSNPGSGGINLDSYMNIRAIAQSDQLMPVITNTDVNSTMMPPPPYQHLDSCRIKALTLWISQGYLNN